MHRIATYVAESITVAYAVLFLGCALPDLLGGAHVGLSGEQAELQAAQSGGVPDSARQQAQRGGGRRQVHRVLATHCTKRKILVFRSKLSAWRWAAHCWLQRMWVIEGPTQPTDGRPSAPPKHCARVMQARGPQSKLQLGPRFAAMFYGLPTSA